MPTLSFEQWGVFVVLLLTLISGLSGAVFGFLGWWDRRRERERQAESAGVPSHDQPLHEKYVAKTAFENHVTNADERFRAATRARKDIYAQLDGHGARIAVLEKTDEHQSRLLHSMDEKLTRLTETLLRDKK